MHKDSKKHDTTTDANNNMNESKIENGQPTLQQHNVMWRFRAYESEAHYEKDNFFFVRWQILI